MSERAVAIDDILVETYPDAHCELDSSSPFALLVATVLSAQTTDARVNQVTPELFARYPSPADLAGANRADVEMILRPLGLFRAKTTSLIGLSARLVAEFSGEVPNSLGELVSLPGWGVRPRMSCSQTRSGFPASPSTRM